MIVYFVLKKNKRKNAIQTIANKYLSMYLTRDVKGYGNAR